MWHIRRRRFRQGGKEVMVDCDDMHDVPMELHMTRGGLGSRKQSFHRGERWKEACEIEGQMHWENENMHAENGKEVQNFCPIEGDPGSNMDYGMEAGGMRMSQTLTHDGIEPERNYRGPVIYVDEVDGLIRVGKMQGKGTLGNVGIMDVVEENTCQMDVTLQNEVLIEETGRNITAYEGSSYNYGPSTQVDKDMHQGLIDPDELKEILEWRKMPEIFKREARLERSAKLALSRMKTVHVQQVVMKRRSHMRTTKRGLLIRDPKFIRYEVNRVRAKSVEVNEEAGRAGESSCQMK